MSYLNYHAARKDFYGDGTREYGGRYIDCLISGSSSYKPSIWELPNEYPKISVPGHEFKVIVNELPNFSELVISSLALNEAGNPSLFVVECFDFDEQVLIDTVGRGYPKYKSAIVGPWAA